MTSKDEKLSEKMSKFNIKIEGGSGHLVVGDNTHVDIRNNHASAGQTRPGQTRPGQTVSIVPKDTAFTSTSPNRQTSVQETQGHSVIHKITQGYALILHNRYFPKGNLSDREGSQEDVRVIKEFCKEAGLQINDTDRDTENLTASQMDSLCNEIARRSFSRFDGFVCFILSHGCEGGIYGTDDIVISVQEIVAKFRECEGLAGKPKLFFIQACRGSNKDSGLAIDSDSYPVNRPVSLRLPRESDILLAHSSVEGFESYRDRKSGSWFIITLIDKLREHAHEMHLMDILTLVNHTVATFGETLEGYKQMPCQVSTLTKFVYFNYPAPLTSP